MVHTSQTHEDYQIGVVCGADVRQCLAKAFANEESSFACSHARSREGFGSYVSTVFLQLDLLARTLSVQLIWAGNRCCVEAPSTLAAEAVVQDYLALSQF